MKKDFKIININKQVMTLDIERDNTCDSCNISGGCGTNILAKYFSSDTTFNRPLTKNAKIGDFVSLDISNKELFINAFCLYIVPILAIFIGAYIGMLISPEHELLQITLAIIGFFSALFGCKWFFNINKN